MTPAHPVAAPAPQPRPLGRGVRTSLPVLAVLTVLALLLTTSPARAEVWPGDDLAGLDG